MKVNTAWNEFKIIKYSIWKSEFHNDSIIIQANLYID